MRLATFLNIVEIRTKAVSLSTLGLAFLYAYARTGRILILPFLLMTAAALLVDMGTTAFNSYFDFVKGVDARGRTRERDKAIVRGEASPDQALIIALSLFAWAGLLGLGLALLRGPWIAAAGAACLIAGYLYNGGPKPVSSTPFGELLAGGCLGSALFLIAVYSQAGAVGTREILYSVPPGLMIASILTVNNACDRLNDREAGRRTLSILIGERGSRFLIPAWGAAAYALSAGLAATGGAGAWGLIPLGAGALASIPLYATMDRGAYTHERKGPAMISILRILILFSLAMGGALALDIAIGHGARP